MSAADAAIVREMLEAFNRGDFERSEGLLHDEIVLRQWSDLPDSDTYEGKTHFVRGLVLWLSGFERGFQYVPEEFFDLGDQILVRVRLLGTGKGSGVKLEQEVWQLYEVRDGLVSRCSVFTEEADARAAAKDA